MAEIDSSEVARPSSSVISRLPETLPQTIPMPRLGLSRQIWSIPAVSLALRWFSAHFPAGFLVPFAWMGMTEKPHSAHIWAARLWFTLGLGPFDATVITFLSVSERADHRPRRLESRGAA